MPSVPILLRTPHLHKLPSEEGLLLFCWEGLLSRSSPDARGTKGSPARAVSARLGAFDAILQVLSRQAQCSYASSQPVAEHCSSSSRVHLRSDVALVFFSFFFLLLLQASSPASAEGTVYIALPPSCVSPRCVLAKGGWFCFCLWTDGTLRGLETVLKVLVKHLQRNAPWCVGW